MNFDMDPSSPRTGRIRSSIPLGTHLPKTTRTIPLLPSIHLRPPPTPRHVISPRRPIRISRSWPVPHDPTSRPKRKRKRKRTALRTLAAVLYHSSLYVFILIIAVLLVASAWGLGEQAWRTGGQKRWSIVVLVAAYVALGISSIIHVWSRLLSVKKILRTMPKPYMPIKQIDLPRKVANHIQTEYSRTAIIAHISQATKGQQEGWGRPGTKWENQHFRTYILGTLPTMRDHLAPTANASPLSLAPLSSSAEIQDSEALKLLVNSYVRMVDKARYERREPVEGDAAACEKVVELVCLTLEMKRKRELGERVGEG